MLPTRSCPRQFAVTGDAEVASETAGGVAGEVGAADADVPPGGGTTGADGPGAPASGGDAPGGGRFEDCYRLARLPCCLLHRCIVVSRGRGGHSFHRGEHLRLARLHPLARKPHDLGTPFWRQLRQIHQRRVKLFGRRRAHAFHHLAHTFHHAAHPAWRRLTSLRRSGRRLRHRHLITRCLTRRWRRPGRVRVLSGMMNGVVLWRGLCLRGGAQQHRR
jgi:hypothetical protein